MIVKKHLLFFTLLALLYTALTVLQVPCLWRLAFRFPCPACGMSRALQSAVRLQWAGYCRYNIMAIPVAAAVIALLHRGWLKKKSFGAVIGGLSYFALGFNFLYYLQRLLTNQIP